MFGMDRAQEQIGELYATYGEFPVQTAKRTAPSHTVDEAIADVESNVVVDVRTWTALDDEVLLVRHTDWPDAGWLEPGGTIDPGETPATAAARETREETGVDVMISGLRGVCKHIVIDDSDSDHGVVMLQAYFVGDAAGGELDREESEIAEVRWFETLPDDYHAELEPPEEFVSVDSST